MPRAARVAEHTLGADKTSEGECEHPQKVVMVKRTSESHKGIEELVVQADNVYQLRGFDSLPLLRLRMPYARQNLQATQPKLLTASSVHVQPSANSAGSTLDTTRIIKEGPNSPQCRVRTNPGPDLEPAKAQG